MTPPLRYDSTDRLVCRVRRDSGLPYPLSGSTKLRARRFSTGVRGSSSAIPLDPRDGLRSAHYLRFEADVEEVEHLGQRLLELRLLEPELVLVEHARQHRLADQEHHRPARAVLAAVRQVVVAVVARAALPALRVEAVGVGHALAVAVVERVQDHHLRALVELLARELRLIHRLARDQRRGRPEPHRLLEAALEVLESLVG